MPRAPEVRWHREVKAAVDGGRPVVALETSIWCQGLPHPANVDGARRVAAAVRAEGAVPAVLAVDGGAIRVGMDDVELEAWCGARDADKVGSRDLGWALATGRRGATTVSACLAICTLVGLPVFVTGGIGGVHRGPYDVSTDLEALARSPVCVVSSGVKSVLDVGTTLEVLETLGVPVLGFGTDAFPVFYSRQSPWTVMARVEDEGTVARAVAGHFGIGMRSSVLLVNPLPVEAALAWDEVEGLVAGALDAARSRGVSGKAVTPFLLAHLAEASGGRTLRANLALIESNARLGARVAGALLHPS